MLFLLVFRPIIGSIVQAVRFDDSGFTVPLCCKIMMLRYIQNQTMSFTLYKAHTRNFKARLHESRLNLSDT